MSTADRRRRRPAKPLARRGLVVTEGTKTEKQYVELLRQHLRDTFVNVSVTTVGVGKDPFTVVRKCFEVRKDAARSGKEYDWCVCLVDRDQHAALSQAAAFAEKNGIYLLVTNVKFEMWLLWHAADIRSPQTSPQLDRLMKKHGLLDDKGVPLRFPIHEVERAVQTAYAVDPDMAPGWIGPDPSSALPLLVRLMRGE